MRYLLPTIVLIALVAAACNPFGLTGNVGHQDDEARLAALYDEILALIGDAPATAADQCRVVPIGAKPCGGPTHYLVYSTAATDSARLFERAAAHAELQRKINRERGLASDCMLVMPPDVALVEGTCVAQSR